MKKNQVTLFPSLATPDILPKIGDLCSVFDGKVYHQATVFKVSKKTFCAHVEKDRREDSFGFFHIPFSKFRPI